MAAVRSSTALLTAFWSLLFQDAAPGKVSHESLMNSILFNTSDWATALPSCVAPTKCHDPGGSRNSMARGRLAGSRAAHNLWSRVHHPTRYSVTETRAGCCNTDEHSASSDIGPAGCKAAPGNLANTAKSAALLPLAHTSLDFFSPVFYPFHFYVHRKYSRYALPYHLLQHFHALLLLFPCSLYIKEYSQETTVPA